MTQIYKGELSTKDFESPEGKKIIAAIFKDQLKHSR